MGMVYRSLYFFTQAYHRGKATDVVVYLAANAKLLGILKRSRKSPRQQQPACAHEPYIFRESLTCDQWTYG